MKKGILILTMLLIASNVFAANFTDNGDGTVTDGATGLMWQQGDDGMTMTWQDALSHCESLSLVGHTDWRLPDIKELRSIVYNTQYSPAIDTSFFQNAWSSAYWSATTSAGTTSVWYVNFNDGVVGSGSTGSIYVRCVR